MSCKRIGDTVDAWAASGGGETKRLKQMLEAETGCAEAADTSIGLTLDLAKCMPTVPTADKKITATVFRDLLRMLHAMHNCAVMTGNHAEQQFAAETLFAIMATANNSDLPCQLKLHKFDTILTSVRSYVEEHRKGILSKMACMMDDSNGVSVSIDDFVGEWTERAQAVNRSFIAIRNSENVMAYVRGEELPPKVLRLVQLVVYSLLASDGSLSKEAASATVNAFLSTTTEAQQLSLDEAEQIHSIVESVAEILPRVDESMIGNSASDDYTPSVQPNEGVIFGSAELYQLLTTTVAPVPLPVKAVKDRFGLAPAIALGMGMALVPAKALPTVRNVLIRSARVAQARGDTAGAQALAQVRYQLITRDLKAIGGNAKSKSFVALAVVGAVYCAEQLGQMTESASTPNATFGGPGQEAASIYAF